ncbi:MAG: hypothetical protein IT203_12010 [Fimbriimonadaceae bacterium]|nr:hypothetical protein [Fimbriimonadaceae bacterium]
MKALSLCLVALASVSFAIGNPIVVTVDGKPVKFAGTRPQNVSGRIMVPVRGVFEAIGAYVEYNPVLHRVTARRENESVELRLGDKISNRNGAEFELDIAPMTIRGRMMVPLRFIAESLGADVNYVNELNEVQIITNSNLPGVKPPPPGR